MELRIFVEPQQGATYDDQLAVALKAEELGFGAFFRSDHYLTMGGDGLPGPTDSWVTLAGLARETSTIRLGTMMTSATFRYPGPLAIAVAQVDRMSGGRVELGIGAGWYDAEHAAYAIPFPPTGERFDRLEDQLAILTGLWTTPEGETFSYDGAVALGRRLARPAQAGPAAAPADHHRRQGREADAGPDGALRRRVQPRRSATSRRPARQFARVRAACEEVDRDPASLVYSVALTTVCGVRRGDVCSAGPTATGSSLDDLRANGLAGTPQEVVDTIGRYAELGAERVYLQILDQLGPRPPRAAGRRGHAAPLSTSSGRHEGAAPGDARSSWAPGRLRAAGPDRRRDPAGRRSARTRRRAR